MKSVCYFGCFDPQFSRNKIYIHGLTQNHVEVRICNSQKKFPWNVLELWRQYQKVKQTVDVIIVGYPCHFDVILAKIISRKPIIFDALCSLLDPAVFSRSLHLQSKRHVYRAKILDYLSFFFAHCVLVESNQQKEFCIKQYGFSDNKFRVMYTGADDRIFYPETLKSKLKKYTVVFRGKFLPEAGIEYILQAATLLKKEPIQFIIIGNGRDLPKVIEYLHELRPQNLILIENNVSADMLRNYCATADILLGQFAKNDRLNRTIPHKAYEAMALKKPYLTADYPAIRGVMNDQESCLLVPPANPQAITNAIMQLINNKQLRTSLSENGNRNYLKKYNPYQLGKQLVIIMETINT